MLIEEVTDERIQGLLDNMMLRDDGVVTRDLLTALPKLLEMEAA